MFKGEYYLQSNPTIIINALEYYKAKLENLFQEKEIQPIPKIFQESVANVEKNINELLEKIASDDPNEIINLEHMTGFIKSALSIYRNDIEKCQKKLKEEFYGTVQQESNLKKELKEIGNALEQLDKL